MSRTEIQNYIKEINILMGKKCMPKLEALLECVEKNDYFSNCPLEKNEFSDCVGEFQEKFGIISKEKYISFFEEGIRSFDSKKRENGSFHLNIQPKCYKSFYLKKSCESNMLWNEKDCQGKCLDYFYNFYTCQLSDLDRKRFENCFSKEFPNREFISKTEKESIQSKLAKCSDLFENWK